MRLSIALLLALLIGACTVPEIKDTPALRATVEAKVTPTVLGKPPMLGGSVRFTVHITPTPTVEASLVPTVTPEPTPECVIKVNWNGTEWIYHLPGQVSHERTLVEPDKGEFFACDEQEAIDAGARKALR